MIERTYRNAKLVLLCGPGISSGHILWTYAMLRAGELQGAMEVEVSKADGEIVRVRKVPTELFSPLLVRRAEMCGIDVHSAPGSS